MAVFLRRLWTFVRPWRSRLFLGSFFGVLYALTNGLFLLCVRLVVDVVFPSTRTVPLSEQLNKSPLLKPLLEPILNSVSHLGASNTRAVAITIVCTIPVVVLLRGLFAYLNVYMLHWAAIRTIADLRVALFRHLSSLSLDFFSGARTGDLTSRIGSDTQALYAIVANSLGYIVKEPLTII